MWLLFKTIEIIQGRSQPKASLADQIARTSAPHLLVSAGKPEKEWGELYDKAGGDRSELWYLPKARHTAALKQYPEEYESRVAAFFGEHLGRAVEARQPLRHGGGVATVTRPPGSPPRARADLPALRSRRHPGPAAARAPDRWCHRRGRRRS